MIQPIYFPSVNYENYKDYLSKYKNNFQKNSNQIAFLSYDLDRFSLLFAFKNNFIVDNKIFYKKIHLKEKLVYLKLIKI